jgi:hypothetical protein
LVRVRPRRFDRRQVGRYGSDQALRGKALGHAGKAVEQPPQLGKLRLGSGIARQPSFELARLFGSRLAVECRVHQFQKSRMSHVSPA